MEDLDNTGNDTGAVDNVENTEGTGAAEQGVEKAPGVGDVAKQLIRDGLGNKEVLAAIKEAFPESKTTMSSVNWYRNHLRGLGEDVKTARELSAAGKPSKEDLKMAKAAVKADADARKAEAKAQEKAAKVAAKADEKAASEATKAQAKADKAAAKKAAKTVQPQETTGEDEGEDEGDGFLE
jgi:peptidoglycan hydrolase CwlO-like protein